MGRGAKVATAIGIGGVVMFVVFLAVRSAKAQDTLVRTTDYTPPTTPPPDSAIVARPGGQPVGANFFREGHVGEGPDPTMDPATGRGDGGGFTQPAGRTLTPEAERLRQQAIARREQQLREERYAREREAEQADWAARIAPTGWTRDERGPGWVVTLNPFGGHDWYEGAVAWADGTPPTAGHAVYPTIAPGAPNGITGGLPLVPYSDGSGTTARVSRAITTTFQGGYTGAGTAAVRRPVASVLTSTPIVAILARPVLKGLLGLLT